MKSVQQQIEDQLCPFDEDMPPPVGYKIRIGELNQEYEMLQHLRIRYEDMVFDRFCWGSHCATCGEPFVAVTHSTFAFLTRNCSAHARTYVEPSAKARMALGRLGAVEKIAVSLIRDHYDDQAIPHAELVAKIVEHMEPPEQGQRDTRQQRALRAVTRLAEQEQWPLRFVL